MKVAHEIFDASTLGVLITFSWYLLIQAICCYMLPNPCYLIESTKRSAKLEKAGRNTTGSISTSTTHYPEPEEIEEAFRHQKKRPARHFELRLKIRLKLQRIAEVICFALLDKHLVVAIAEGVRDQKSVKRRVLKELRSLRPINLIFKSWRETQLSHESQCRLHIHRPLIRPEERTPGPAADVDVSYDFLIRGLSKETASIGIIIVAFLKQQEDEVPDDIRVIWLYLVTVAHLLPISDIKPLKHGRFYTKCFFMCGGKENVTEACPFGCSENTKGYIVPGRYGHCHNARGSFSPLTDNSSTAEDAMDILLVPISNEDQRNEIFERSPLFVGKQRDPRLIKVDYYPFSTTPDESKIEQDLRHQTVCMYSTRGGQLLSGKLYTACACTRIRDHDGNSRYYNNVLLYSVAPQSQYGDSGSALFAYLDDPSAPGESCLYLVGFQVAFPPKKMFDCFRTRRGMCAAVRAESNIDKVIQPDHVKFALIPEALHTQLIDRFMEERERPYSYLRRLKLFTDTLLARLNRIR